MNSKYCVMLEDGITLTDSLLEATHRLDETTWQTKDGWNVWEMRDLDGNPVRLIQLPPEVLA